MARISLLFSLAFALALGSLFFSVSGHAPTASPRKPSCPKTVSELQTLPFTQITEILNRKERLVPKTPEFKTMFTMCKGYVAYLESLYKIENPIVDVLGIAKARYALMTKSILVAQASVKVDKKASLKLKKSCAGLTKGFLQIQKTIVKISAKHDYKADCKLNLHESKNIGDAMTNFNKSLNAFIDVVSDLKKKVKKVGDKTHGRELTEADVSANSHVGADVNGFENVYEKFYNFFGGYLGGENSHGRELNEVQTGVNADGKVNASDHQSTLDKFYQFFGPFLNGKQHGREIAEAPSGVNAEAPAAAGGKVNGSYQSTLDKFYQYFGPFLEGKQHGRELTEAQIGVNAGAQADGKVSFEEFSKYFSFAEAHGRKLLQAKAGVNAGAQAGVKVNGMFEKFSKLFDSFRRAKGKSHGRELTEAGGNVRGAVDDFLNHIGAGNRGKVQFDSAGKMKVAGKDGFRSLKRAHNKHFV